MLDYLKGSIVQLKLNFENASETKLELTYWQISSKRLLCLEWGDLIIVNDFNLWNIILSKHFDLFPKNNNGYFVAYFY